MSKFDNFNSFDKFNSINHFNSLDIISDSLYKGYRLSGNHFNHQKNHDFVKTDYDKNLADGYQISLTPTLERYFTSAITQNADDSKTKYGYPVFAISLIIFVITLGAGGVNGFYYTTMPLMCMVLGIYWIVKGIILRSRAAELANAIDMGHYTAYQYEITDMMWDIRTTTHKGNKKIHKYFYLSVNGVPVEVDESTYVTSDVGAMVTGVVILIKAQKYFVMLPALTGNSFDAFVNGLK